MEKELILELLNEVGFPILSAVVAIGFLVLALKFILSETKESLKSIIDMLETILTDLNETLDLMDELERKINKSLDIESNE